MIYRYIKETDLNEYEKENKRLSYSNLFYNDDALILCNNIALNSEDFINLELQSGFSTDDVYADDDVYQYYIINDDLARRLMEINEVVFYHNTLDIYVLGVTHYGTNWGYVLTDLKLVKDEDDNTFYKAIYEKEDF